MTNLTIPNIDIMIDFDGWASEDELRSLVENTISTASNSANLKWADGAELSIVFSSNAEVQKINKQWREMDKPTNVLSFPSEDISVGEDAGLMIGDIILAFETLDKEAREQSKRFEHHLTHLLVHGFLHLFGYDHLSDVEAEQMEALETRILKQMDIADPYAAIE